MTHHALNPSCVRRSLATPAFAIITALFASGSARGDTSTVTGATASATVGDATVVMDFPVTRSGDASYDAIVGFHTVDGTAVAGTDYIATAGRLMIPAGTSAASIPVTISAAASAGGDLTFQLVLDEPTGVGAPPSFTTGFRYPVGTQPTSVATADINGDGKPDIALVDGDTDNVVVYFNITTPGSEEPAFAPAQTFALGGYTVGIASADINGDGLPDLVFVGNLGTTVLINTTMVGSDIAAFAAPQSFVENIISPVQTLVDFNGDGKVDVIQAGTPNTGGPTSILSVMLNTTPAGSATVSFASPQIFQAGGGVYGIGAGDLNGDGRPDLLLANANSTVSVLTNLTEPGDFSASLAPPQSFNSGNDQFGSWAWFVAVADVNGDFIPDVIVANWNGFGDISILINNTPPGASTISLSDYQGFASGVSPVQFAVADFNGDGKTDIAIASGSPMSTVSILANTTAAGSPTVGFMERQSFAAGAHPIALAVSDFNGDGKPDLAVADNQDDDLSVLINSTPSGLTAAGFDPPQAFASGNGPRGAIALDLNGDGKPDVAFADFNDGTLSVMLDTTTPGAPTASFSASQPFATGANPYTIAHADINADGLEDLIAVNVADQTLSVLLNETALGATAPNFAPQQLVATEGQSGTVTAADLNGDGLADLIVGNLGLGSVSVFLNTTQFGAAVASFAEAQDFAVGRSPISVAVDDVNGDGLPDLAISNDGDGTVSVLLNTTSPGSTNVTFSAQQTLSVAPESGSLIFSDVNGDGRPDLLVAINADVGEVAVLLNNTAPGAATASFASPQLVAVGTTPNAILARDIDGDGKPDLVAVNLLGGSVVQVLLNTTSPGSATASFGVALSFAAGANPGSIDSADFNGDGKPDLVVANHAGGLNTVSVLLNTQFQTLVAGSPALGTIVHDAIFANGFD